MQTIRNERNITITIDSTFDNKSVHDFFTSYYQSKKYIHALRMSQDVEINTNVIKQNFNMQLHEGDTLSFPFYIEEEIDFIPQDIPIDIAYEDAFFLIVNKQPGLLVHPSLKDGRDTLVNGVSYYYHQTNQKHRIRYLHRLDVETSGLIVFVKNAFLHAYYDKLLQERHIKRYYYAIVMGIPKKKHGMITANIGRDRHHKSKQIVTPNGNFAQTHYRIIKTSHNRSLVECQLETGRTHQIRVHLNHIGHPIIGDTLYNMTPSTLIDRHALHAYKLLLKHPFTHESFEIQTEIPEDMKRLL